MSVFGWSTYNDSPCCTETSPILNPTTNVLVIGVTQAYRDSRAVRYAGNGDIPPQGSPALSSSHKKEVPPKSWNTELILGS